MFQNAGMIRFTSIHLSSASLLHIFENSVLLVYNALDHPPDSCDLNIHDLETEASTKEKLTSTADKSRSDTTFKAY
jgi:hypothetical protein